jgi:hypothetical protein
LYFLVIDVSYFIFSYEKIDSTNVHYMLSAGSISSIIPGSSSPTPEQLNKPTSSLAASSVPALSLEHNTVAPSEKLFYVDPKVGTEQKAKKKKHQYSWCKEAESPSSVPSEFSVVASASSNTAISTEESSKSKTRFLEDLLASDKSSSSVTENDGNTATTSKKLKSTPKDDCRTIHSPLLLSLLKAKSGNTNVREFVSR